MKTTAYDIMKGQGGRWVVSFICTDEDGNRTRYTSHYNSIDDIRRDLHMYKVRYNNRVSVEKRDA